MKNFMVQAWPHDIYFEANIHNALSLVVNIFIPIEACNLQISLISAVSEPIVQVTP